MLTLLVRVDSGDPMRLAEAARRLVLSVDDGLPLTDLSTMERNIAGSLAPQPMTMAALLPSPTSRCCLPASVRTGRWR